MPRKTPQMSVATIKVEKTPSIVADKYRRKEVGKKFKLNFSEFVYQLFFLNSTQLPRSKKMTDGEIARQILIEFSHIKKRQEQFTNPDRLTIHLLRNDYNYGRLLRKKGPPKVKCFCFDEDGDPINPRYAYPVKLAKEEINDQQKEHETKYYIPWTKGDNAYLRARKRPQQQEQ
jgi:hypothetical protein